MRRHWMRRRGRKPKKPSKSIIKLNNVKLVVSYVARKPEMQHVPVKPQVQNQKFNSMILRIEHYVGCKRKLF